MKKLLVFLLSLLIFSLYAEPVDQSKARKVARNWYNYIADDNISNSDISYNSIYTNDELTIHMFEIKRDYEDKGGFVLVSADDRAVPILGFSDNSNTSLSATEHYMFDEYLNNIGGEIIYMIDTDITNDEIIEMWEDILYRDKSANDNENTAIPPMIDTEWGEGKPFNSYCPSSGLNKSKAGSLALAMAQLMNYHSYPFRGSETITYYLGGTQTNINLKEKIFNWDILPAKYSDFNNYTKHQVRQAIYLSAAAANTSFVYPRSYGRVSFAINALINNFKYSNEIAIIKKKDYSIERLWIDELISNLQQNLPAIYVNNATSSNNPTEAAIIDGYFEENFVDKKMDYFHLNWGQAGQLNGYFVISKLNPYEEYDYPRTDGAIVNIKPQEHVGFQKPKNLKIKFEDKKAILSWDLTNEQTDYYNIYRNDELIETTTTTSYIDNDPIFGDYLAYYVTANSSGVESKPSNTYILGEDDNTLDKVNSKDSVVLTNSPNPFNPNTEIRFNLNNDAAIKLMVYAIDGKLVKNIDAGRRANGLNTINFNAGNLTSGVYFYRLTVDGKPTKANKMILLK